MNGGHWPLALIAIAAVFSAACSTSSAPGAGADPTRLPVGDGALSDRPAVGSVFSCSTSFSAPDGVSADGPWFNGDGTWDATRKVAVDGMVTWPSELDITVQDGNRVITGNGLPDHPTGTFPVSPADDAYAYDRNPNGIRSQALRFELPAAPAEAATQSCLPLGPIGVLRAGGVLFDALDAVGNDAVAHEVQDACQGHPQQSGQYHYHQVSECIDDPGTGHSVLVGYAFDGFGIFGSRGEDGRTLTDADLDECHGHTHRIDWDGVEMVLFHYHGTLEYPYTLGCFRGEADAEAGVGGLGPPSGQGVPGG